MARMMTWHDLRELAGFQAEKGCAISLYLNLDPSTSPTAGDAHTRLNSLLDEGVRSDGANRRELTHDQRRALRADFDRIRRYFEQEFSREGARGLAAFSASLDNLWRPFPVAEPVRDEIAVGRRLRVAPLVRLVGRGEGAVVLFASREQGRLYRLLAGRLEELVDQFDEQPRRHDQGGWSQARYQRHVDALAEEHLRAVAEELERRSRRLRRPPIVVMAPEETWAEFQNLVSDDVRHAIVGWSPAEAHASPADLLALATPVLERWRADREQEIVARWREETARNGRAASGWGATLEAASDGRVELLLFEDGTNRRVWECPACGRAAAEDGKCPLDGTRLEARDEGVDLALHRTLAHGGSAWAVGAGSGLEGADGIGALLRY